jgi:signal peptidase II
MARKLSGLVLNLIFVLTGMLVLGLDQYTKYYVNVQPVGVFPIEIIPKFIYILKISNSGAAFGFFQNKTNILIVISIIAIILIIVLKIKLDLKSVLYNVALGFILGGATGNLIDRIIWGEVTDFLHVVYFAVFNVADSFICIGFVIIIIIVLRTFFRKEQLNNIDLEENNKIDTEKQ